MSLKIIFIIFIQSHSVQSLMNTYGTVKKTIFGPGNKNLIISKWISHMFQMLRRISISSLKQRHLQSYQVFPVLPPDVELIWYFVWSSISFALLRPSVENHVRKTMIKKYWQQRTVKMNQNNDIEHLTSAKVGFTRWGCTLYLNGIVD